MRAVAKSTRKRNILIPQVVEPAQPPMNIRTNISAMTKPPHCEKSAVA